MKLATPLLIVFSIAMGASAFAGIPYDTKTACPVGGEKFTTTSTASCTTMGRTMSMQPVTSCDFVTRLPQCPTNKLPLYKDFSDNDILQIREFMKTEKYKVASAKSRYYLASTIEKLLSPKDAQLEFFLLQHGLWYTPGQSYTDPDYMTAYHTAAATMFKQDDLNDKVFWMGAETHAYIQTNKIQAARKNLGKMKAENIEDNTYLASYIKALDYCITSPFDGELCSPSTPLRAHEKNPARD